MLDLATCREILGDAAGELTDEQLEELRDQVCGLARIIVDSYEESRAAARAGTLCPTR